MSADSRTAAKAAVDAEIQKAIGPSFCGIPLLRVTLTEKSRKKIEENINRAWNDAGETTLLSVTLDRKTYGLKVEELP